MVWDPVWYNWHRQSTDQKWQQTKREVDLYHKHHKKPKYKSSKKRMVKLYMRHHQQPHNYRSVWGRRVKRRRGKKRRYKTTRRRGYGGQWKKTWKHFPSSGLRTVY